MDVHQKNKEIVGRLRAVLYDCEEQKLVSLLSEIFHPEALVHLSYPFEDMHGPKEYYQKAYAPLLQAIPDLERRDYIVIGGSAETGDWVGCAGYYIGVFERPWLDIPPTCHPVVLRYAEFYRLEEGKIVEVQALWDIPQVMMQARAWPLAPSLGVEWLVPGPATDDGIVPPPYDKSKSDASKKLVEDMLTSLGNFAEGGHEAMNLPKFWHPKMSWYGPAGIGSNRRISGFRNWHQIPFLKAMPDRVGGVGDNRTFLADGDYVGFTAWPGMSMKLSDDGWLGIAPSNKNITMRSLDFWRCENGMLRENWILVDLLDVYNQLGVDVFSRMREFTVDRQTVRLQL
jgi:predicted ester cyclase